ncbi:unnamed protein product, partial [Ectocarpus sp. 8 AP-2014]
PLLPPPSPPPPGSRSAAATASTCAIALSAVVPFFQRWPGVESDTRRRTGTSLRHSLQASKHTLCSSRTDPSHPRHPTRSSSTTRRAEKTSALVVVPTAAPVAGVTTTDRVRAPARWPASFETGIG